MEKILVVYFSGKGNNKFLAELAAKDLDADIETIRPFIKLRFLIILAGLWKLKMGIKNLKKNPAAYEKVILFGPVWMGSLIPPLKAFIEKYSSAIENFQFCTCCGSRDEEKDDKYGYNLVFNQVKELSKSQSTHCFAFPIAFVLKEEDRKNSELMMKTRLNSENFKGLIKERFDDFISEVKDI